MRAPVAGARRRPPVWLLATLCYVLLAVLATWPLLRDADTKVAGAATDPVLNTGVLVWNATTTPFSNEWWNPPHFAPTPGVVALTENLLGMSPVASPVYWLTGNPWLAYNLSVFVTWPLSACAAYLLVFLLTRRSDAAFVGGLAFAFSPYRVDALPHLQTLATFGIAATLAGAHGYLQERRWPWLLLAGLGWMQQAMANGYYVLYGGLFIALWWGFFCTRRDRWKPGLTLVATWAVCSVPLVPMLLGYRAVHEQFGLHRTYTEILYFSALAGSWFETHKDVWLWSRVFAYGKDNLFPGLTVVVLTLVGVVCALRQPSTLAGPDSSHSRLRPWLVGGVCIALASIAVNLVWGRVDTELAGVAVKMTDIGRAVVVLVLCAVPLVWWTPRLRDAVVRRSPLLFYVAATLLLALLSCGPELRTGTDVVWKPAPYGWLMTLPGFNEVRVPTQLKMIGLLALSVSAALCYGFVRPRHLRAAAPLLVLVSAGILADGWMTHAEMATAPAMWPAVEPVNRPEPILELPLGDIDWGALLRASIHHRRTFNGTSGYDPPHYFALKQGLDARNPATLAALASLGAYDIVVDGEQDPDGSLLRYAASAAGAVKLVTDGPRTLFRVPAGQPEPSVGAPLAIAAVDTAHHTENKGLMLDNDVNTGWADLPDTPDAWVIADLGAERELGGITEVVGDYPRDFPRRLVVEVSNDREAWTAAWAGPTDAHAFLAFIREPRNASLHITFPTVRGRYVRLRETESPTNWRIQELRLHAPLAEPATGSRP